MKPAKEALALLSGLFVTALSGISAADVSLSFVDAAGSTRTEVALASSAPTNGEEDRDAVRVFAVAPPGDLPASVSISSRAAPDGDATTSTLELLRDLPLESAPCPAGAPKGSACGQTAPLRVVFDDIDRLHPLVSRRSILAELGGAIVATAAGVSTSARVTTPDGRHRAHLRVHVLRMTVGGPTAIGRDEADAARLVQGEVGRANGIWGACGIGFGPRPSIAIEIVDPPPPWLLAIGCGAGLPASGGALTFSVDGRELTVPTRRGQSPRGVARVVAAALGAKGYGVTVSDNGLSTASGRASVDLLVRRKDKKLATITAPLSGAVSSDPTLDACIGRVALEDGLQHFGDADAVAGTLEERTLVKAFEDGDPSTLDVFVIPSFGGDSRIGESFIFADSGAIKNTVIVDRAGFRAHRASFTLAHEVGHVLLDQPGHPDDFGVDTPTRLMDADAVNASAFGPRRLEREECARALRQSGPRSPSGLLVPWSLPPLP